MTYEEYINFITDVGLSRNGAVGNYCCEPVCLFWFDRAVSYPYDKMKLTGEVKIINLDGIVATIRNDNEIKSAIFKRMEQIKRENEKKKLADIENDF